MEADLGTPGASEPRAQARARKTLSAQTRPPFDAVLLLSFGGPEGPEDVLPFLENVTRGRSVPRERLETVAEHYHRFGGRSPINDECRRLLAALRAELAARGPALPVYWGNRNWHPMLADTLAEMARDGVKRAVAVATSAYSSYSSCRQYLEDIERARAVVGAAAPLVEKIPPFWSSGAFLETMTALTQATLEAKPFDPEKIRLVFTAHSIPLSMSERCDYEKELREAARRVQAGLRERFAWYRAWQSRSGPPNVAWLEPDVLDLLRSIRAKGVDEVVLVPIGFVADHMEVIYDLDVEARAVCEEIGLAMRRVPTVGAHPRFVAGLRDLVAAAVEGRGQPACAPGCCLPPSRG